MSPSRPPLSRALSRPPSHFCSAELHHFSAFTPLHVALRGHFRAVGRGSPIGWSSAIDARFTRDYRTIRNYRRIRSAGRLPNNSERPPAPSGRLWRQVGRCAGSNNRPAGGVCSRPPPRLRRSRLSTWRLSSSLTDAPSPARTVQHHDDLRDDAVASGSSPQPELSALSPGPPDSVGADAPRSSARQ